jgi:competence protein ComEC
VVVPALRTLGVRRLDAVVLTHPHQDHAGGLAAVLRRLPAGMLLEPETAGETCAGFRELVAAARERGVPRRVIHRGAKLNLDGSARLEFLGPAPGGGEAEGNNGSVVALYREGPRSALLMGDCEAEGERTLPHPLPHVDLLKVAHHGSRAGTTAELLSEVHPQVAVISCGAGNPFGHPDLGTLRRLREAGSTVYRTDLSGAVTVTLGKERITVSTQREAARG